MSADEETFVFLSLGIRYEVNLFSWTIQQDRWYTASHYWEGTWKRNSI